MKRRILAILLAALLVVMLCEMHVCCGEDCAFCAQTEPVRRISACAVAVLSVIRVFFHGRAEAAELPICRRFSARTLVELKVEMTD